MPAQLQIQLFQNDSFGGQLARLYMLLQQRPVTCKDCSVLGIAGTALPRRIKDLKDKHNIQIQISKKEIVRVFDKKKVKISKYSLI